MNAISMRTGSVDGKQMSLSPRQEEVGAVYQTLRGTWKIITEYHGKFEMCDGPAFGYTTRQATEEEIEKALQPMDSEMAEDFWGEFSDNTDYIR